MELTAVLTHAEEGGFIALNPDTGTTTQGETAEEAVANLKEATALYLAEFPLAATGHQVVGDLAGLDPGAQVQRARERLGFQKVRQSGSHVMMKRESKGCVIPMHAELKVGTLAGVLRQADVAAEDFIEALRG